MKPHKLQLIGFHGIQSAKGRDEITIDFQHIPESARLVAIKGPNGTAKTTIIDNMHPYRVMPSHSKSLGPGGFSFWDHIYLPQSKKILEWEHLKVRYRSSFVFKMTGKTKKAEYYLEEQQGPEWRACTAPDGTTSDGKAETYDVCIDAILGTPETFFTSNYSAQRKKSISDYAVSDFKSILANILNLEYLKKLSEKANAIGRMLFIHLDTLQADMSIGRQAQTNLGLISKEIAEAETNLQSLVGIEQNLQREIRGISEAIAMLREKQRSNAAKDEQRKFICKELDKLNVQATARRAELDRLFASDNCKVLAELTTKKDELGIARKEKTYAEAELAEVQAILERKDAILQSKRQVQVLSLEVERINEELKNCEEWVLRLPALRQELQKDNLKVAEFTSTGKSKKTILLAMVETGKLANEVPCVNTNLQPRCPLMKEALAAREEIPAKRAEIDFLWNETELIKKSIVERSELLEKYEGIEARGRDLIKSKQQLQENLAKHTVLSAQEQILDNASAKLLSVQSTVLARSNRIENLVAAIEILEASLLNLKEQHQGQLKSAASQFSEQSMVLEQQLETIEPTVSEEELTKQEDLLSLRQAESDKAALKTQDQRNAMVVLLSKKSAMEELVAKGNSTMREAERIGNEIAKFKLLEKGLGNDGLIALSIDDAGPEISAICNDLFKACFESRFSIRMETQKETLGGNLRETFKILVFDNHRGNEKDLDFVSGGENVWINEALIRAIALYKGQCSGVQYGTLFSDESDGPLDPEKKRKYMAIKRYVLERGGYAREYFITQTQEIWEMADYILDVTTL